MSDRTLRGKVAIVGIGDNLAASLMTLMALSELLLFQTRVLGFPSFGRGGVAGLSSQFGLSECRRLPRMRPS